MADSIAIAQLWTEGLSSPDGDHVAAVGDVLADEVVTVNALGTTTGRAQVLAAFGKSPLASAFAEGRWSDPSESGNVVTSTCTFPAGAPFQEAVVAVTVEGAKIRRVETRVAAGPHPVDALVGRVWGDRPAPDALAAHLQTTYDISVTNVTNLDVGVFRVDRRRGTPWVARAFARVRPLAAVESDAALLQHLEASGYLAERCATDAPVSDLDGHGVVVTNFVEGKPPDHSTSSLRRLAEAIGRLHATPPAPAPVAQDAGALHLYTIGPSLREEIDNATASLRSIDSQVTGASRAGYEALREALADADDFSDLPYANVHTDLVRKNVIATSEGLVPIDWASGGLGPRVVSLSVPLFFGSLKPGGWAAEKIDLFAAAYSAHVQLTDEELDRLPAALEHRHLTSDAFGFCIGTRLGRRVPSEWFDSRGFRAEIAAYARTAFAKARTAG